MTRKCSKATREKLAKTKLPPKSPRWLRSAVWNARSGYPMSAEGETRMCEALGIAPPKRAPRRFYRPCLSVELGEAIRKYGIDAEAMLWLFVKWEIAAAEVEANPDAHEHGYAVELEL